MTTIKPGDTMTNPYEREHTVINALGPGYLEIESRDGCRRVLILCAGEWRVSSYSEPWTHTPARPTITNSGQRLIADGSHYAFALIGEDGDLPEGWDASKVAAAVAKHLNTVDLDELTVPRIDAENKETTS